MSVSDLIAELCKLPADADVFILCEHNPVCSVYDKLSYDKHIVIISDSKNVEQTKPYI